MYRRQFLKFMGSGLTGLGVWGLSGVRAQGRIPTGGAKQANPRGTADNVIFINLAGGASHVDTFDLKLGAWTPGDFEPTTVGNMLLPAGLFPNLVTQGDKFSLLRCLSGNEVVHQRAAYLLETAHSFNPVFAKEQPHLGSIIALEAEAARSASDILPPFLAFNSSVQGPGLLASTYAGFQVNGESGIAGLAHPDGQDLFNRRYAALKNIDPARHAEATQGAALSDFSHFYTLGEQMMYEPDVDEIFSLSEETVTRYGDSGTGRAAAMAVQALAKGRGTRFIQITQGGWDHHYDIYDRNGNGNIYSQCAQLDSAVAAMLTDLAATPGRRGGSLLDETLVVVTGEFGRTPANLTNNRGRDHYPYAWSALLAGGGIRPGQAFGATDDEGWGITDPFWDKDRTITTYDLTATLYSSLGIDWTKEIQDTPSGRVFEYTPKVDGVAGYYTDILELFS